MARKRLKFFLFKSLRTLLHLSKTQLFLFQAIPHSLLKTPGVGGGGSLRRIFFPSTCGLTLDVALPATYFRQSPSSIHQLPTTSHLSIVRPVFAPAHLSQRQLSVHQRVRYNVAVMARSDVQLMLDVKAGDEQSFTLLLHRYRTPLVNFLYRMVRNREQAEDLAQEVFLRVYRAREDYVPSAKFTTWLFRIATNLALNSMRDTRYQRMEISLDAPVTVDAEEGEEKTLDIAEKHPNIEQHLIEETRKKMIRHAIEKLPEKQRAAVLLHKYQELDYGEISKILECSESALKSLLFRAYETLRVELAPLVAQQAKQ